MAKTLNHGLMIALFSGLLLWGMARQAFVYAEENSATPPPEVSLPVPEKSTILVELYSSQACVFCPQADRLFADLAAQPYVIALACHVDYFDVFEGSLAQPFCTERQSWYMKTLSAGPNYTPQIIVNGQRDVIGYRAKNVAQAMLQAASMESPRPIDIVYDLSPGAEAGSFKLSWTPLSADDIQDDDIALSVFAVDAPHDITIAEGRNKGQNISYVNIASDYKDLGQWDQKAGEARVLLPLDEAKSGIIALAQSKKTGRVYAAGQYFVSSSEAKAP